MRAVQGIIIQAGCQSGKIRQGQIFAWGTKSLALPWNSGENLRKSTICLLQSPTGEILDISSSLGDVPQELSFVFVETRVEVIYVSIERQTGYTLVYFRFIQPAPGIWRIFVGAGITRM